MKRGEEESLRQYRREVNIKNIFPVVKQGKRVWKLLSPRNGKREHPGEVLFVQVTRWDRFGIKEDFGLEMAPLGDCFCSEILGGGCTVASGILRPCCAMQIY